MNVRITKARFHTYWYSCLIGETFSVFDEPVLRQGEKKYECRGGKKWILVDDCEIVKENVPVAMNAIENWADVEELIRSLLPPVETIDELFSVKIDGGVSVATRDWMNRIYAARVRLDNMAEATYAHVDRR